MSNVYQNREIWIDAAKGVGIICVVIGHVIGKSNSAPGLFNAIYLFHMPLFFLASGYFHKINTTSEYAQSRAWLLLVPYASYIVFYSCIQALQGILAGETISALQLAREFVKRTYGGQLLVETYTVFWFVPVLYMTGVAFNFMARRWSDKQLAAAIVAAALLAWVISQLPRYPTPLNVAGVPAALACYTAGYLMRRNMSRSGQLITLSAAVIAVCALLHFMLGWTFSVDMKYLQFGPPLLGLALSLSISYLLMMSMKLISRIEPITYFLSVFGVSSVTLMFSHQWLNYNLRDLDIHSDILIIVIALVVGVILHRAFALSCTTAFLFLGKREPGFLRLGQPAR